jgi:hypothetical protein
MYSVRLPGYFWADMARLAAENWLPAPPTKAFYTAKLQTARFYFQRILPRTRTRGHHAVQAPTT